MPLSKRFTMSSFVGAHLNETMVVLGTGPSAYDPGSFGRNEQVQRLLSELPVIALNRAFSIGVKVNYQVSLDKVYTALLKHPSAKASLASLKKRFVEWSTKYNIEGWTFEDWVQTYCDKSSIDFEVLNLLKLSSPHAPFIRFLQQGTAIKAPYEAVGFNVVSRPFMWNNYKNGLVAGGNTAHAGIALASVMGARKVLFLGVDMTKPSAVHKRWEVNQSYYRKNVKQGFKRAQQELGSKIKFINLNPNAELAEFEKTTSYDASMDLLISEVKKRRQQVDA